VLLPPTLSQTGVHVDGLSSRIVEGGPRRWGRAGFAALAVVAMTLVALAGSVASAALAV
jgi:hypothetical protein